MQYINKKRAAAPPKHYRSIHNKHEMIIESFKQIINYIMKKYNNIIYLTLTFMGVFALLFGVKPLCRLIFMFGGVL